MGTTDHRAAFASIVRELNSRTADGAALRGHPDHQGMTDAELDTAMIDVERAYLAAMHTSYTDPDMYGEYADAMREALAVLGDAITRLDTVVQPRDRHLATCDVERQAAYIAMITLYPEALGLLKGLDTVENAARSVEAADVTNASAIVEAVTNVDDEATALEVVFDVARLRVGAYTAFLATLPVYTRVRSRLGLDGDDIAAAAQSMTLLGVRLDRARSDMAAAFAADRRRRAAPVGASPRRHPEVPV